MTCKGCEDTHTLQSYGELNALILFHILHDPLSSSPCQCFYHQDTLDPYAIIIIAWAISTSPLLPAHKIQALSEMQGQQIHQLSFAHLPFRHGCYCHTSDATSSFGFSTSFFVSPPRAVSSSLLTSPSQLGLPPLFFVFFDHQHPYHQAEAGQDVAYLSS